MARSDVKIALSAEDRASRVIGNVRQELMGLDALGGKLSGVLSPLGGIVGMAAALGGAGVIALKRFAGEMDDLADTAEGLGIGAVALAEMRSKAAEAGVEAESLNKALAKVNAQLVAARAGDPQAKSLFSALGIDVKQVENTEQAVGALADKLSQYGNTAERSALMAQLFGEKIGPKLSAYLTQGSQGLRQFSGITEDTVAQAGKLQGEIDKLAVTFERLKNSGLGAVVPFLNNIADVIGRLDFGKIGDAFNPWLPFVVGPAFREYGRQLDEIATKRRQAADALKNNAATFDEVDRLLRRYPAPVAPTIAAPKAGADKVSEAERFLKRLQEQAVAAHYTAEEVLRIEAAQLGVAEAAAPWLRSLEAAKDSAAAAARFAGELKDQQEALRRDAEREADEYVRMLEQARQLAQAGESRQDTLARELATIEKLNDAGAFLAAAGYDAEKAWLLYGQAVDAALDKVAEVNAEGEKGIDVARELGLTFSSAFEDAIVSGSNLSDVLKGLEKDIVRIISRKLVTEPLANAVTGMVGKFDFGALLGSFFGGGMAAGGPVYGNTPYLVGERGPELFVPQGNGRIVDSAATSRALGGRSIVVNINVPAGTSSASANQIGAAAARALTLADARLN